MRINRSIGKIRVCELASDPEATDLIEYHLGFAREQAAELRRAMKEKTLDPAQSACEMLIQTAKGYGFTPVELVAREAIDAMKETGSITGAIGELQRLVGVCDRLQGSKRSDQIELESA